MPRNLKFSIVTPSFNQAATLPKTMDSVLSQEYPNLEYFIYDARSTDGSGQIIKKFANNYPKTIKFQIRKDRGQADALNLAFSKSTGDILAFINSDDYYLPDTFSKVSKYFLDHPECQWLVGDCQVVGQPLTWTFWLKEIIPYDRFPSLLYLFNFVNQPAVFIRRNIFQKAGIFDINLHYCFDYDFWLRLLKVSSPHRLKVSLASFRISATSKGSTGFQKQFTEDYLVVQKYTNNSIILAIHWLLDQFVIKSYAFLKKNS